MRHPILDQLAIVASINLQRQSDYEFSEREYLTGEALKKRDYQEYNLRYAHECGIMLAALRLGLSPEQIREAYLSVELEKEACYITYSRLLGSYLGNMDRAGALA
jgi:hypothetical protein